MMRFSNIVGNIGKEQTQSDGHQLLDVYRSSLGGFRLRLLNNSNSAFNPQLASDVILYKKIHFTKLIHKHPPI